MRVSFATFPPRVGVEKPLRALCCVRGMPAGEGARESASRQRLQGARHREIHPSGSEDSCRPKTDGFSRRPNGISIHYLGGACLTPRGRRRRLTRLLPCSWGSCCAPAFLRGGPRISNPRDGCAERPTCYVALLLSVGDANLQRALAPVIRGSGGCNYGSRLSCPMQCVLAMRRGQFIAVSIRALGG